MGALQKGVGGEFRGAGTLVIPNPRFDFSKQVVWLFQRLGLINVMSYPLTQLPTFDIYILRSHHLVLEFSLIIIYIIYNIIYIIIKISIFQFYTVLYR